MSCMAPGGSAAPPDGIDGMPGGIEPNDIMGALGMFIGPPQPPPPMFGGGMPPPGGIVPGIMGIPGGASIPPGIPPGMPPGIPPGGMGI